MAAKRKPSPPTEPNPIGNRPRRTLDRSTDAGEIGARIREARDRAGLDLYSAAAAVGITAAGLQKIELGQSDVKSSTLLRIAKAFGVDAGSLLKGLPRK